MENISILTQNITSNEHNISSKFSFIHNENNQTNIETQNILNKNNQNKLKVFSKNETNNDDKSSLNLRFFGKNLLNLNKNVLNNKIHLNKRQTYNCPNTTSSILLNSSSIILEKCQLEKINDPQYVIEYSKEIVTNMFLTENNNKPKYKNIFIINNDLTENSRRILINWIISVHNHFELLPETLYLTINILDRVISGKKISLRDFQLIGVTALLIASKYEEIYAPEIRDFIYITGKLITKTQILQMENQILSFLNFDLIVVSPYMFLNQFYFLYDCKDIEIYYISLMLIEMCFLNEKFLQYNNSLIAVSLFYLAIKVKNGKAVSWNSLLKLHSGYDEKEVKACMKEFGVFFKEFIKQSKLDSIIKKYEDDKYGCIIKKVFKRNNLNKKID
jgi:cyclin B